MNYEQTDNPQQKMKYAIERLVLSQPFYATLLLHLRRRIDTSSKSAFWTDGVTLGWNPSLLTDMTISQVMGGICRLITGLAYNHHLRRTSEDVKRWNKASLEVSAYWTTRAGIELSPQDRKSVTNMYGNESVEHICKVMEAEQQSSESDGDEGNEGSEGNEGDKGNKGGDSESKNNQQGQGNSNNQQQQQGGNGAGSGEIRDYPAKSSIDRQMEEEMNKSRTLQAACIARGQGKCPADMERFIEEMRKPQCDWKAYLKEFVQATVHERYDWTCPNKRFAWRGMYVPSRRNKAVGNIVVAIDTSGSINEEMLAMFLGELNGVIEDNPSIEVKILYCDAELHEGPTLTADDIPIQDKVKPIGGGGTDFKPVFDWIESNEPDTKCLLYFTDLMGVFPEAAPAYPVLWCVSDCYGTLEDYQAPFGEYIQLKATQDVESASA